MKRKSFPSICILLISTVLAVSLSCGGGGGAASFSPDSNQLHNGGGNGGWGTGGETGGGFGGTSIEQNNATLLIGQVAALDVTSVDIILYVNNERFEINNVDETTTTEVLPRISVGDTVSGTAYIHLTDGTTRQAQLDVSTIGLANNLKFKVPYHYICRESSTGSIITQGEYFSRDGIDLSASTTGLIAGWKCTYADGTTTTHNGAYVTGVRGDIELTAMYNFYLTNNVREISRPSALISSLGITQDSEGTSVKPATAQLTVQGSSDYTYSYDNTKITISSAGELSIASGYTPPLTGENVTITATDNAEPLLSLQVTIKICRQHLLALYKDRASYNAGSAPDYKKLLGGTDASTDISLNAVAGNAFRNQRAASSGYAEEIVYWKRILNGSSENLPAAASIDVTEDTKAYAGWKIFASPPSVTVKRFTGNNEVIITSNYPCSASSEPGGFALESAGSPGAMRCIFSDSTNLNLYDTNAANGVYNVALRFKDSGNESNYIDVPIRVEDCISVDANGVLTLTPGMEISSNLVIPASINGTPVTKISANAFANNTTITSLTVNGNITIEESAFNSCSNLTTINLSGISSIGFNAFFGTKPADINITASSSLTVLNGFGHCTQGGSLRIPVGVTSIETSCFAGARFEKIYIPKSVNNIAAYAFDNCVTAIYYEGISAEWSQINIEGHNSLLGFVIPINYEAW